MTSIPAYGGGQLTKINQGHSTKINSMRVMKIGTILTR